MRAIVEAASRQCNRGRSARQRLILPREAAALLGGGTMTLLVQAILAGGAPRPGAFAHARRRGRLDHHGPQLIEAVGHVAALIAEALGTEDQLPLGVDPAALLHAE